MRLIHGRTATMVLLAVNALLGVIIGFQLVTEAAPVAATAPMQQSEARIDVPMQRTKMDGLSAYEEIVERPLFWSERQLIEEMSALAADSAQSVMPFVLLGVVTGVKAKALLGKPGAKEVSRVTTGDVVEGWVVEAVTRQGVVLVSGGVRRELQVGPGLETGR